MRSLLLDLDSIAFDGLFERARAIVPTIAPGWTDHNTHDPGIMLLELLAWVADAQIYALSRTRRDERAAYARLLGIVARGPVPARGLVWPSESGPATTGAPTPWPAGTLIDVDAPLASDSPDAPVFHVTHPISLTAARLVDIASHFSDGTTRSWNLVNVQEGTTFYPFGEPLDLQSRLVLRFEGDWLGSFASDRGLVSIGFEIVPPPVTATVAERTPHRQSHLRRIEATLADADGERPLTIVEDTTGGMLRSGVLLFAAPSNAPAGNAFTITVKGARPGMLRTPHMRRVGVNVLPAVQRELVDGETFTGTGDPDQTYALSRTGLIARANGAAVDLLVDNASWTVTGDLTQCGPDDARFEVDGTTGVLSFGNGINGRVLPRDATAVVRYGVTAGAPGNIPRPVVWTVRGVAGAFGINSEAMTNGADALTLADLRRIARHDVRLSRPLVTRADLEEAALALADLGVARAFEPLPDALRGRRPRGARTLVVVAADGDQRSGTPAETADWLEAVRTQLASRLPLGQRLSVIAPRYVAVSVRARLMVQPNIDPVTARSAVLQQLGGALSIVASPAGASVWPFGRDVAALTVKGWLRRVPGIARVVELTLVADGRAIDAAAIALGPIGLPLATLAPADIVVERWSAGGQR